MLDVVDFDDTSEATLEVLCVEGLAGRGGRRGSRTVGSNAVIDKGEAGIGFEVVGFLEKVHDLGGLQLPADCLGLLLYDLAELDLQRAREIQLQAAQDDPGGTTLAALRVDTDDCFVCTTDVLWVKRQIRD